MNFVVFGCSTTAGGIASEGAIAVPVGASGFASAVVEQPKTTKFTLHPAADRTASLPDAM